MNVSEAFLIAAAVAILYFFSIGEKVIHVDLSGLLPKNFKRAKRRRLLAKCDTPLQGKKLHGEIRKAFEKVMIPLWKSDKRLLPARMDRNFRRKIERQMDSLSRQDLCQEIRVTDVVPLPQNGFKRWSDDGREWRESILQCSVLERFVSTVSGRPIQEIYRKNAFLRILQSRHVRNSDRTQKKENYYADIGRPKPLRSTSRSGPICAMHCCCWRRRRSCLSVCSFASGSSGIPWSPWRRVWALPSWW